MKADSKLFAASQRFMRSGKARTLVAPLVLALVFLATASSQGQEPAPEPAPSELEQLLAKHYEARGGLDKLRALSSYEVTGRLSTQGFEIPLNARRKRPNKLRMEMDAQGMKILQVYDGAMAWGVNPMAGQSEIAELPEAEAKTMANQASFDSSLVDPEKQGLTLELVGKEELDGAEAYKISITSRSGEQQTLYLDAETYLEKRRLAKASANGQEMEIQIDYDDFAEVDGVLMIAKQTNVSPMGTVEIYYDDYDLSAEIADEVFLMPGQEADPGLTLEQVVAQHIAARTKPEAAEIQTVRATGQLTLMGFQLPLEMSFARPSSTRLEADMQGMKMILAYDGETAWTLSPMQGIPEPEALPPEAESAIALFSDFLWGLLAEHEAQGHRLELAGIETVDRDQTYKILMTTASGEARELYLGGEDFLEHKVHLEAVFLGMNQQIDALLDDYRSISGLMVPHQIELLAGGTPQGGIVLENFEVNVEIDPTIFALPPAEPAADGR